MKGFSFFYSLLFLFFRFLRYGWMNSVLLVSFFFHLAMCSNTRLCVNKVRCMQYKIKSIHFKRKFCSNLLSVDLLFVCIPRMNMNKILWFRPSPNRKEQARNSPCTIHARVDVCRCGNQTLFDAWLKRNVQKFSINLNSSWQRQWIVFLCVVSLLLHFFPYPELHPNKIMINNETELDAFEESGRASICGKRGAVRPGGLKDNTMDKVNNMVCSVWD